MTAAEDGGVPRRSSLRLWRSCRDELASRIERFGASMSEEEHFRAYEEFEVAYLKVRWLEYLCELDGGEQP